MKIVSGFEACISPGCTFTDTLPKVQVELIRLRFSAAKHVVNLNLPPTLLHLPKVLYLLLYRTVA